MITLYDEPSLHTHHSATDAKQHPETFQIRLEAKDRDIDRLVKALVAASQNCIYALNDSCWAGCKAKNLCPQADLGEIVEDLR